mgnify:CR=1 FL=1
MNQYWGACYTKPLAERDAQRTIEDMGFGTFIRIYAKHFRRFGEMRSRRHPLMPGYVLVALEDGDYRLAAAAQLAHWTAVHPAVAVPVAALVGFAAYATLLGALHPAVEERLRYCLDLLSPARVAAFLRGEIGKP